MEDINPDFSSQMLIQCAVCLDDIIQSELYTITCGHKYHMSCISNWYCHKRLTCPLCRRNMSNTCISTLSPSMYDENFITTYPFPERIMSFKAKSQQVSISIPSKTNQLELLAGIINIMQQTKIDAENESEIKNESSADIHVIGREIELDLGNRYVVIKLPRGKKQMIAINAILNAAIDVFDDILLELQIVKEESLH